MQGSLSHVLRRKVWPWVLGVIGCAVAYGIAQRIPQTLTIFSLAALIAFGVAPVTRDLERRIPRSLAIVLVYLSLVVGLGILLLLVVPSTIVQMQAFLSSAPEMAEHLQRLVTTVDHGLHGRFGPSYAPGLDQLRAMLTERLESLTSNALASVGTLLVQAVTGLFILISALVLSAFFVSRAEAIGEGFRRLFPPSRRHLAAELENELARVFGGFVSAQLSLCIIMAIAVWASLTIVGAPFAVLAGAATGFGYAIPFVGMLVVQVGAALLAMPDGWAMVIRVTLVIFAIARIVDTLLVPQVMSESVGVSPIIIMFAVFAGGELFGFVGLAMGIPLAALAKTLWNFYLRARVDEVLVLPSE